MSDDIRPVGAVDARAVDAQARDRRGTDRRSQDRRAAGKALVPVDAVKDVPASHDPAPIDPGSAIFAAQMLGQGGQKRGIKGGPVAIDQARATYLGAEYSGSNERRPAKGEIKDKDV